MINERGLFFVCLVMKLVDDFLTKELDKFEEKFLSHTGHHRHYCSKHLGSAGVHRKRQHLVLT